MVDKLVVMIGAPGHLKVQAQAGRGLPEAAAEHARPHGVVRGQEGEHALEEPGREGAKAVLAARRGGRRFLVLEPLRHSVEQADGAGALLSGRKLESPPPTAAANGRRDASSSSAMIASSTEVARWSVTVGGFV